MKQTIVLAVFSFLVSLASATWFAAYLAPPRSTAAAVGPRDSAVAPGSAKRPRAEPLGEVAVPGADTAKRPASAPAAPVALPKADTMGDGSRAKAVAKILAAMKPKAAADIVARLNDDEVERIVRQLNPKQVAALLAALPEERAAALSRRLLESKPDRPGGT